MKERTRKIFIMIVMAALIVSLMAASFAALTYGRYSGGRRDENSAYDDILDLVGETAFEVSTADELVNAINNGYSYIKISDDAEEPFVVNNNVADVYTNLVLDVNGHKIVRNSRNPLLDVQKSVSVVLVYDSSTTAEGGFYNPVGSALQTSGGTLTVGAGVYESGPRTDTSSSVSENVSATVCSRDDDRTAASYSVQKTGSFPKLTKETGDVYLTAADASNSYLDADTYLIYTEEKNAFVEQGEETVGGTVLQEEQLYVNAKEVASGGTTTISAEAFSPICNVASCDFYYYYPVSEANEDGFYTYAVVYGYHDVKALARDEKKTDENGTEYGMASALQDDGLVWPYAAIRSEAGNTHARGGAFKTHFGEENTYCIYSAGGTMTVGGTAEPTFSAVQSGVCIRMREGGETEEQRSAPSLTIDSGVFSSEIGDTIKMSGGEMEVKKGSFTKTGCKKGTDAQLENQTAIISLTGGTLNVSGTKTGDGYSVTMTAGGTGNGGTLENVFGIRADDGGTISTTGVSFHIYGDYSAGVLSYDGKIDLGNDTAITVTQSDQYKNGTDILLTSAGVSSEQTLSGASENEEHPVNLSGGVTITSNGLGITARGVVNVKDGSTSTVTTERGTGIYVNNGQFKVEKGATINVISTVLSGYSWTTPPNSQTTNTPNIYNGVYVQGGSLVSEGTLNVTFTGVQNDAYGSGANSNLNANTAYRDFQIKSYAVRVEGDAAGDDTEVIITAGTIINQVQYDEQGEEIAGGGGGVYVGGGTVTLGVENGNTGPTVQTRGTVSYGTPMDQDGGNWNYFLPQTGGPAVKVAQSGSVSSTLTVYGGTYTAQQGDGIVTVGGTSYIHNGTFIGRDYGANPGDRAGPGASYSFKVYGGTANVYGGTFGGQENGNYINSSGAFVMGTSEVKGTANIYGGTFVVSSGNTGGQAGFSVYEYGNVLVDPKGGENGTGTGVTMTGLAAGLVIEGNTSNAASVEIKGGNFSSTRNHGYSDGIWYSNSNARLTISGGTFTGYARSGLWFDVTPEIYEEGWIDGHGSHYSTNVKITGGGFKGNSYAIYAKESGYWESGSWNERPSYAIGVNYIIVPGSLLRTDNWNRANAPGGTSVGYGQWNPDYWNDALEGTIINCKKIAVGQYYIETWWQQN